MDEICASTWLDYDILGHHSGYSNYEEACGVSNGYTERPQWPNNAFNPKHGKPYIDVIMRTMESQIPSLTIVCSTV